jgi:hypothetical protein
MQWAPVWRLYGPLGSLFLVTTAESPRYSHRGGVGAIVYACGAPAIWIVVVPARVIVLLGLRNLPHSLTGMVDPSLPGFTIAPCVDSLLCYRIDQAT